MRLKQMEERAKRRARRAADQVRDSGQDVMAWAGDNPLDAFVAFVVVFVLGFGAGWWVYA